MRGVLVPVRHSHSVARCTTVLVHDHHITCPTIRDIPQTYMSPSRPRPSVTEREREKERSRMLARMQVF